MNSESRGRLTKVLFDDIYVLPGVDHDRVVAIHTWISDNIAHDEVVYGFSAIDLALGVLELVEERFMCIVGRGQADDPKTGEQAPPALADGLNDVLRNPSLIWVIDRFLFQAFQEGFHFPLDLARFASLSGFIFEPQEMRQFY